MDGLLIVDKPAGLTSAEVVRIVKRRLRCKTGHIGTLDPFASGVLPVCVGEGTKIAQFLNTADKEYRGLIRLGSETDTGDPTGSVTARAAVPPLEPAELRRVAAQFTGEIQQVPPMYSAVKRQGTPLYKLARQGIAVERQPRRVCIKMLRLTTPDEGAVALAVSCSKGTYIRVLAQQIAVSLGSVGHLEQLCRVRVGHFGIEEAMMLSAIEQTPLPLIGLRDALRHLREIRIDASRVQRARQGYEPMLESIPPGSQNEAVKLVGPDGLLAAVIVMDEGPRWRFARVFADGARAQS
jgi:tRNA pseudouridine55 synthase